MATMKQAAADLAVYIASDIPAFVWGAPGIGKSDVVRQVAAGLNLPVIDLRANLMESIDFRGLPVPDVAAGMAKWLPPEALPNATRDGPAGLLFLDELPQAAPSVFGACLQLVLDRRVGEYVMPTRWVPVAAGNRMADRAGGNRIGTALNNRFAHIECEIDPTAAEWSEWAASANLHPAVIAFLRFRPSLQHVMPTNPDEKAFPSPRAWERVSRVITTPDGQRFRLVAGIVGTAAATELEGFIRIWRALPSIPAIVADPRGVKVPGSNEPGLAFAISAALARTAASDARTFGPILEYAGRMPREYEVVTCVDAIRRNPALKDSAPFVAWAVRNQDIAL